MEVPTHFLNGWTKDVAIKMPNPLVEGEYASMPQVERAQTCTLLTNNIKGPRSTNNNIQTSWHVSLPKGLNSTKKHDLDKKWATLLYDVNIPFNVVRHPTFIKVMKATSKSWTYYKTPSYHGLCINLLKQSEVDVSK
jgi:hypothetical protein